MTDTSTLAEELANSLWLQGHAARHAVLEAIVAAQALEGLIRQALLASKDHSVIAEKAFVDLGLIAHVSGGGSALEYFLEQERANGASSTETPGDEQAQY